MPDGPRFLFPDVLGLITGGVRFNVGVVQCAFGIYPRAAVIGRPFEGLVLLQNACDKALQVDIALQRPQKDSQGRPLNLITPKEILPVPLQPGEVGMLHIPLIARTPTLPGKGNAVGITIEPTSPYPYNLMRPPDGGRMPTQLALSAIRLQILRDIGFTATKVKPGLLAAGFDLLPGDPDAFRDDAVLPRYETLWTTHELPQEQAHYAALAEKAEQVAKKVNRTTVLEPLIAISERRFALAGFGLHPGEALVFRQLPAYMMENGLYLEERLA